MMNFHYDDKVASVYCEQRWRQWGDVCSLQSRQTHISCWLCWWICQGFSVRSFFIPTLLIAITINSIMLLHPSLH